MAAALGDGAADTGAIADAGRTVGHRDAVAALQPRDGGLQLLVIDAAQDQFVGRLVMVEAQRGVFLQQPGEGAGQLDVVLAIGGFDGDRAIEGGHGHIRNRRQGAGAEPLAGTDAFKLGQRHHFAFLTARELGGLVALHGEERAEPLRAAISIAHVRAFAERAAQ